MKIKVKWICVTLLSMSIVLTGCRTNNPTDTDTKPDGEDDEERTEPGVTVPVTGFSLDKNSVTLTIYSSEQLTWTITPPDAGNQKITWTSSAPTVASVDKDGKITALNFSNGGSTAYPSGAATGTAVITGTTPEGISSSITVTATTAAQVDLMTLPPMKDQFKDYFLMGNITKDATDYSGSGTSAEITNTRLKRHYNILTSENNMKPQSITNNRNASTGIITYTWNNADNFVNACINSNYKVHAHTLLWHSQNAQWMWDQIAGKTGTIASGMTKDAALTVMKKYITEVMDHYKGKIYSWDVLNEAFPDNASSSANWKDAIRKNATGEGQDANPWYIAIGSDVVYEGFLAARKADPSAILYYNDYNTDNANRARLIRDMVKEVNDTYLASSDKPAGEAAGRLLIEGIGMQEHHNTGVSAALIKATIDMFRPLGVKISVSELDVLGQAWNQYSDNKAANTVGNSTVTNQGLLDQARLYGEYMKLYINNKDIIERVSLWGIIDSQSWRQKGLPLIFDQNGKAKPAYYKMINALN
jgi:endo-1,4-beta-xylanase